MNIMMTNSKMSLFWAVLSGMVLLGVGVALGLGLGAKESDQIPETDTGPQTAAAMDGGTTHAEHGGQESDAMDAQDGSGMEMSHDGTIRIARSMATSLGIRSVAAEVAPLHREIRAAGSITYDETRLSRVAPRFGGWVERLHVGSTGQAVRTGEPLLEIYSPELVSAQEELLAALRLDRSLAGSIAPGVQRRGTDLVEAARRRLQLWDISPEQIQAIEESGEVRRTLVLHSPTDGFVVEKNVELGARVQPGTDLYRIGNVSRVWLEVDVYESDLRFVRTGQSASIQVEAYPGEPRSGTVSFIYPEIDRATRTGRVRVEIPNSNAAALLRPGMFATAHLEVTLTEAAVLLPRDAVLYFGDRDVVFVEHEPGIYEVREVQVGAESGQRTQILHGVAEGERVVARANFFLDAESRLMESMIGQPGMEMDMDMPGMESPQTDSSATSMPGMDHEGMDHE